MFTPTGPKYWGGEIRFSRVLSARERRRCEREIGGDKLVDSTSVVVTQSGKYPDDTDAARIIDLIQRCGGGRYRFRPLGWGREGEELGDLFSGFPVFAEDDWREA